MCKCARIFVGLWKLFQQKSKNNWTRWMFWSVLTNNKRINGSWFCWIHPPSTDTHFCSKTLQGYQASHKTSSEILLWYVFPVLCSSVDLRKVTGRERSGLRPAMTGTHLIQALSVNNKELENFSLALYYSSLDKTCVCLSASFPVFNLKQFWWTTVSFKDHMKTQNSAFSILHLWIELTVDNCTWSWHHYWRGLFCSWGVSHWCFCCCHIILRSVTLEMYFSSSRKSTCGAPATHSCEAFPANCTVTWFVCLLSQSSRAELNDHGHRPASSSARGRFFRRTKVFALATPTLKEPHYFAELLSSAAWKELEYCFGTWWKLMLRSLTWALSVILW